jgi:phosphatidylglycerophosphate synthase
MSTIQTTGQAAGLGHHVREHRSVLAEVEKRTLVWLAVRLPRWVNSDHLTGLGAIAMLGTGAAFAAASLSPWTLLLVPPMLAVNWFGDSLDGTVARVRNTQRPRYGYYVDHVVDVANVSVLFAGLALSGLLSPWIAAVLLVGYLLLSAESFLATHALGVFRISFAGFGPSELRILLSIGALAVLVKPVVNPFGLGELPLFDVGGTVGALGMLGAFVLNAARNTVALYRAEPLKKADDATPR